MKKKSLSKNPSISPNVLKDAKSGIQSLKVLFNYSRLRMSKFMRWMILSTINFIEEKVIAIAHEEFVKQRNELYDTPPTREEFFEDEEKKMPPERKREVLRSGLESE